MPAAPAESSVKVFAPASVANFGPGFDALGAALQGLGDTIEATRRPGARGVVIITEVTGPGHGIPLDTGQNCAGRAAAGVIARLPGGADRADGIELRINKGLPPGSGLGSSACSAVAGAVAANLLYGAPLDGDALLEAALEGEAVAGGTAHADNVSASLLGGFTIVSGHQPVWVTRLEAPADLRIVVALPAMQIATRDARSVLPRMVTLADAAANWARVGALVAAVAQGRVPDIGRAVVDRVIEPARRRLIPGFDDVKRAAIEAGAYGCSISGSGPSLFAVATPQTGEAVGNAMQAAFGRHRLASVFHVCAPENQGARRID